ncbi:MAG TPA: glycosyltransferase [Candidatus Kapabacteria bacterium]|jgi:cellulose synthase/poly-beta-1,6-N-acetylglucosamine synthase-like glycosyltransferase|nr:glycosyltransferase [Candidatus Kapabacteria bacterium]
MIYLVAGCILLLLYSYVGFPLLVSLLATLRPKQWNTDETYRPSVSIILPAYNEELALRRCLSSLLNLNYPLDRIEILCGSDGSTDRTNAILHEFAEQHSCVKAFFFSRQRGKMLTLNDLVDRAKHDILLFVDADVTLNPNALLSHVRHYADPKVGGVAGRLMIASNRSDGVYRSESMFLTIENNLRRSEAQVASTVGLYGGNYSIRRALWARLPNDRVYDDFFAVLTIVNSGKRLLYEEEAVSTELYGRSYIDEFKRKTRNASRCLYTLTFFPRLLIFGPAAWLLWPHKILRWTTGFLSIGVLVGSIVAYFNGSPWSIPVLIVEGVFLALVGLGALLKERRRSIPVASALYWFFNMNVAFMVGCFEFLFAKQVPIWSQTTRVADPNLVAITEQEVVHS